MGTTSKIRLFVAIFPPFAVAEKLADVGRRLGEALPGEAVSRTALEKIHVTLHFLGGVEAGKVAGYEEALAKVCPATERFALSVAGLGCFPGPRRPRILWAGIGGDLETLKSLRQGMEPDFVRLGYMPEDRPFHPHLTIGRVKDINPHASRSLIEALEKDQQTDFGEWPVERVDLMQSSLSQGGASYSVVKSFLLPQPAA